MPEGFWIISVIEICALLRYTSRRQAANSAVGYKDVLVCLVNLMTAAYNYMSMF